MQRPPAQQPMRSRSPVRPLSRHSQLSMLPLPLRTFPRNVFLQLLHPVQLHEIQPNLHWPAFLPPAPGPRALLVEFIRYLLTSPRITGMRLPVFHPPLTVTFVFLVTFLFFWNSHSKHLIHFFRTIIIDIQLIH